MSSAAEAEVGGLFGNAHAGTAIHITLIEMDHPQPPTPLVTDNTTAHGIMHGTGHHKQSRPLYVFTNKTPKHIPRSSERTQRGCVEPGPTSDPRSGPTSIPANPTSPLALANAGSSQKPFPLNSFSHSHELIN
mmetsp:Transcript_27097/g.74719  ORF Transcript_27097/g.74719 Transcript_27097/m.74719 type:complete len:133 (-) Transcript_27097:1789-2187(-)